MKKTTLWISVLAAVLAGRVLNAQDITGDWLGTLSAGGAELRLALHISKASDGSLKATLDSIDQGANGIPIDPITVVDSKLKFTVPAVSGTYEGKVNAAGSAIDGTWSQGQPLALEFRRGAVKQQEHKAAKPSDIDGAWRGTLDAGQVKLPIVFHIVNTEDGLTATCDSPDQGLKGIPVTAVTRNGSALKLEMKQLAGVFEGKISADLSTIDGTWTQGANSLALVLTRVKDAAELERRRPQNPVKPYPYREEEVAYSNPSAGFQLGATLTIPPGQGPFPAVVLITGSGQQDRDESLMGHRPFLVLADHLTRKGIVVLRADDRGIGKSGGDFAAATTADFATDTEAGIAYLKTRPEANPHKLGLIGHSEGGVIAPMVAARNSDVAFIVMMAGTGVRGDEILPAQVAAMLEASGQSHEMAEKKGADEREMLALVEHEKDSAVLQKKLREMTAGQLSDAQLAAQIKQLQSPWLRYFLEYDPAVALRKVQCPVLAINGGKDRQVPPGQNLPAIRQALEAGGNRHFEADELPGLNHLFQTAKTGAPGEYAEIEETMSPVALEKISSWILKQ
jgi:fermentation-respiration switch protein FrsA (DUF1100 family)